MRFGFCSAPFLRSAAWHHFELFCKRRQRFEPPLCLKRPSGRLRSESSSSLSFNKLSLGSPEGDRHSRPPPHTFRGPTFLTDPLWSSQEVGNTTEGESECCYLPVQATYKSANIPEKDTEGNVCLRLRVRASPTKNRRFTFNRITIVISANFKPQHKRKSTSLHPFLLRQPVRMCFGPFMVTWLLGLQSRWKWLPRKTEKKVDYRDKKMSLLLLGGLFVVCFF